MNTTLPRLTIIIVSWNVRELLKQCLASISAMLGDAAIECQIIVVDNASHDSTPRMVREEYPQVELIETGANLGYAGGNNLGIRHALDSAKPADYLFILNPDTQVVGNALTQLVLWMQQHPDVAVVGPLLRYPDGSIQSSRRRIPTPGVFFFESTPLEWRWPHNRWARRYRMEDLPADQLQDVDWLVGAALLVRRSAIQAAGVFDASFSLYSEELEWQRRLRRAGRIVYLPTAEIMHYEGQSSAQIPTRRLILFHVNRLRYIRMYHGIWLALLVRLFLLIVYGAEALVEGAKWLAGHKRAMRAARVRAYLGLVWALVAAG